MAYVKNGKKACADSKVIREEIIENCFVEAYRLLFNNNKDIVDRFLNRINVFLKENNTKSLIQKLECQKQVLEEKQNSLLNLVIDGTIDKEIYNAKKNRVK